MASERRPAQNLLFGGAEPAPQQGLRRSPKANGYAARPGTGPEGQTCGSCAHCALRQLGDHRVYKCALCARNWTSCRASDVLLRSPACRCWEQGEGTPKPTSIRTTTPRSWRD